MTEVLPYGPDPEQYGELTRAHDESRGVVVVVHGGFWRARYDLSLGRPLATDLAGRGWDVWNLEYRRVGNGGGVPQTLDDVAAGIDHLASLPGLDLTRVVVLGHSAGGHLAAWSAARSRLPRWPVRVPVTAVISQAGVLDLRRAYADRLGDGAVEAFLGGPPETCGDADPAQQLPLGVPLWCVHATGDDVVPVNQSRDYVTAARAAGGRADLVEVAGDHFTVIDPTSPAWARTVALLTRL